MNKGEFQFCERCRIIVARDLDMPPDDIDMVALFTCAQRAILARMINESDVLIISPIGERENQAFRDGYAIGILEKLFDEESPFDDYAIKYEDHMGNFDPPPSLMGGTE